MKHLVRPFIQYLKTVGYSASMIGQIRGAVVEYLELHPDYRRASQQELQNHYNYLSERPNKRRSGGLSSITIGHHLYALQLFYSWLVEEGKMKTHPMAGLRFPRPESRPREILTIKQIGELYQVADAEEKAILGVFYGCGLRRSEAAGLDIRDVQCRTRLLYVRAGKGGKRRVIPMSEQVAADLRYYGREWRYQRCTSRTAEDPYAFFLSRTGTRMSGNSFYRRFHKLLEKTGNPSLITKRICLHSLRHSIATHLLHNGMPVESVRDFLGHSCLESTQVYTRINFVPPLCVTP